MKSTPPIIRPLVLTLLVFVKFVNASLAQEVSVPDPGLNAAIREALGKPAGPLTQQDMLSLTNLSAVFRNITNVQGLEAAQNLVTLDLQDNRITSVNILTNLTRLVVLDLGENRFPEFTLPPGLTNLTKLRLEFGVLTNLTLPPGLSRLTNLAVGFNRLTSLALPADMTNLIEFSAFQNRLTNLTLPPNLPNLKRLNLDGNNLPRLRLPAGMTQLVFIALGGNQLTSFTVPTDATNLTALRINDNQLTKLTIPPDLNQLSILVVSGNPLTEFVLSEPLATTGLASVVGALRTIGIPVFSYPLTARLVEPVMLPGSFKFGITGPPGVYSVLASTNFARWSAVGVASNPLGSVIFHDVTTNVLPQTFYRILLQVPPANMVFIPPNTFTMGTPTNELNRQADEGPQTTVTISRGFWMGKFEVTQREYLAVVGSNPSQFTGNLDRPVETVSWLDATNYCAQLTQQALATGRILPGSYYRLPTEAEWECTARASTATRFSYGEDPDFTGLAANAWYAGNAGFETHPVGQKLSNPWGLFDLEGNVLEWCQDWYGAYPGGIATDPQGPASNAIGVKVIRGGAWDSFASDCRSGRRQTNGVHPFITDSILGFRVVLVTEPQ